MNRQNRITLPISLADFAAQWRGQLEATATAATPPGTMAPTWSEAVFDCQARSLFSLQFQHNPIYQRVCASLGRTPATVHHWSDIPAIPTRAFREQEFTSLPETERTTIFYSSGTTGQQPSRHFHSQESLDLYEASLLSWFQTCFGSVPLPALTGGDSERPASQPASQPPPGAAKKRLILLTPPPALAPHSSLVHMFETLRRERGEAASGFTGQLDEQGAWILDLTAVEKALQQAETTGIPVLVMGTAFSFVHLTDAWASRNTRYHLPEGSQALETGGYKGRSRSVPKAELYQAIARHLGIKPPHIRCEYGMCELSSQAYARPEVEISKLKAQSSKLKFALAPMVFHFPPWARVRILSPETGRAVGEGETGLIQIFDLANVYSVLAIQTEDLGVRRGSGFELLGRAATAETRGCSLMVAGASERGWAHPQAASDQHADVDHPRSWRAAFALISETNGARPHEFA